MQKIESKYEREKRSKRNKTIAGSVMIVLMILSSLGYAFFSSGKNIEKKVTYNGVKFTLSSGFWQFRVDGKDFYTTYNPKETENITSTINKKLSDYSNVFYFSRGSEGDSLNEILRNLNKYTTRFQPVCLDNCTEDLPIKDCTENIIIIQQAAETLIKQEDNCVYILGAGENSTKAADAFLFKILSIK